MIEVNNLTSEKVNLALLKKIGQFVLEKEGKGDKNLSVALVEPDEIKRLNKKYRNRDCVTDVLSFLNKNDIIKVAGIEKILIGEVVLCPEQIKRNAEEFGNDFKKELYWALIHGLLHLLDYNHQEENSASAMRKKEKYYLDFFNE